MHFCDVALFFLLVAGVGFYVASVQIDGIARADAEGQYYAALLDKYPGLDIEDAYTMEIIERNVADLLGGGEDLIPNDYVPPPEVGLYQKIGIILLALSVVPLVLRPKPEIKTSGV